MNKKNPKSNRNAQDIIDDSYNSRDYNIIEKGMNSYVMPLDMVRDQDAIDSEHFYPEDFINELNNQE